MFGNWSPIDRSYRVSYSAVALLVVSSFWPHTLQDPRPCANTVVVETDTTVQRAGSDKDTLLRWSSGGTGPEYPTQLRSQGLMGRVVARFAVDTNGRVMPGTAAIVSETHREFGQSVCQFLKRARFQPVPVDGRKRTVTVAAAPFEFSIR
ncbi:MAG: hypothetical protein C0516_09510 [Gemmatimonas sp.]|uniref:energy transducer TonB n=1 Tax=Gemmatimonas sp. UBA7669 TaxID=1946568 RepID=UPI0031CCE36B|nr:hypothetical protein [Gemmatimonas sp.]